MSSPDPVRSPSFSLSNQYKAGRLTLYHFDFYRLDEPGIMANEITEILADPEAVVAVEWPKIVQDILPAKRLTVKLSASGETKRRLEFTVPAELSYLC